MSVCQHILTFFLHITEKLSELVFGTILDNIGYQINTNTFYMSTTFKPLADRVLIEPAAAEQVTASGIIIPDTAKEKPLRGKVIAVGNGKTDEPMNVNVGDLVIFGQYSGTEIKIDGANYLIMRESDIYGIIG
jgi:chaperonin GroES